MTHGIWNLSNSHFNVSINRFLLENSYAHSLQLFLNYNSMSSLDREPSGLQSLKILIISSFRENICLPAEEDEGVLRRKAGRWRIGRSRPALLLRPHWQDKSCHGNHRKASRPRPGGKTRSSTEVFEPVRISRAAPWGVAGSQCCTGYPTLWGGSACLTELAWIAFALREGREDTARVTPRGKGSRNPCCPRPSPPAPRDCPQVTATTRAPPSPSRYRSPVKGRRAFGSSTLVLAIWLPPFLDGAMALRWRLRGARVEAIRRQRRRWWRERGPQGGEGGWRAPLGVWIGDPALPGPRNKGLWGTHLQVLNPGWGKPGCFSREGAAWDESDVRPPATKFKLPKAGQ